jgi:membrane protein DedA with SNARE-associated domain
VPTKMFLSVAFVAAMAGDSNTGIVAQFFDPAWNVEHRYIIWPAIVIILFLSGFGVPLPEDVPLTLSGFTTTKLLNDQFVFSAFALTFIIVVVPILSGDIVAYSLGRRFGFGLRDRSKIIASAITDKGLARVSRWFDQYGNFTVFLGRQVAGVRFVTFYTAGAMRMKLIKFIFFDFIGCFVSVPVWLTLGHMAAMYGKIWLDEASKRVGTGFLVGTAAAAVLLFLFAKYRSFRQERR